MLLAKEARGEVRVGQAGYRSGCLAADDRQWWIWELDAVFRVESSADRQNSREQVWAAELDFLSVQHTSRSLQHGQVEVTLGDEAVMSSWVPAGDLQVEQSICHDFIHDSNSDRIVFGACPRLENVPRLVPTGWIVWLRRGRTTGLSILP
jgi:hypothetical protein